MHSAAYILIHTLQNEVLKGTEFCKATMKTIQLKIIKIAARVKILKTKIQIELPKDYAKRCLLEKMLWDVRITEDLVQKNTARSLTS